MSRITGVVHASGAGAGHSPGEEYWNLVFSLDVWRVDGGALRTEPLRVHKAVRKEDLSALTSVIRGHTLIAMDAQLKGKDAAEIETAELDAVAEAPVDPELSAALAELERPVTVEDDVLGTLTLDRRLDQFVGRAMWMDESIEVTLEAEGDDLEDALATAHALWKDQASWHTRVRDFAVEQLLGLKNGSWLGKDESHVTPEEFRTRMKLGSIRVDPEGTFEFWHDDGDLFWGHAIQISGSLEEGPKYADIPG